MLRRIRTCPNFVTRSENTPEIGSEEAIFSLHSSATELKNCELRFISCGFATWSIKFGQVLTILVLLSFFWSCQNPIEEAAAQTAPSEFSTRKQSVTRVKIIALKPQIFQKEIISQGKIEAKNYSEVTFDLQERIEEVLVETGQRVRKGAILARLRDFEWQNQLQKIDHQIEQAKIKRTAKLISLGYTLEDSLQIPPAILKTSHLESNLEGLKIERSLVLYKLESTKVKAPLSGIVADVEAQVGNPASNYKKLCTIIDDRKLEAVFPILEQELPLVQKGQKVVIKPLYNPGKSYEGTIRTFIPQVDKHGMVKMFARINKTDDQLLDGMHVSAFIMDQVNNQIVIPKSAVVDRQGKQVVFIHKGGQAHWKYVQIELENSESYSISEGLEVGDEVIVNNNFHLAHLEKVEVER